MPCDEDKIIVIENIIHRWENRLCPECGASCKTKNYVTKCSEKPNEHMLCDNEFYLRKIKEVIEE